MTTTLKSPKLLVAVTVSMDLAVPFVATLTPEGLNEAGVFEPAKNIDKDTVPENPLTLMTLIVELREVPCSIVNVVGFAVRRNEGPALPPFT
jgi:hypothetical protein